VAVPELRSGSARYRVSLGEEPIGVADLSVRCEGSTCLVRWATRLRLPAEAGGAERLRVVEVSVDRRGRATDLPARVAEDGRAREVEAPGGRVPAIVAEVLLAGARLPPARRAAPAERCLPAFDEATGEEGRACVRSSGRELHASVLGVSLVLAPGRDGLPARVAVPEHGFRYARDPAARVPENGPVRVGVRVPGSASPARARRFCGLEPEPVPAAEALPAGLPAPRAAGLTCRDKAAAWLAAARGAGHDGRIAVGVAWDGSAWVWHAWAEIRGAGDAWLPVDPAFGQAPAGGPRFVVARYRPDDPAGGAEAGRRILACWGRARVE
jgi:hypothetical protein